MWPNLYNKNRENETHRQERRYKMGAKEMYERLIEEGVPEDEAFERCAEEAACANEALYDRLTDR
jgi:hypothetical protein